MSLKLLNKAANRQQARLEDELEQTLRQITDMAADAEKASAERFISFTGNLMTVEKTAARAEQVSASLFAERRSVAQESSSLFNNGKSTKNETVELPSASSPRVF